MLCQRVIWRALFFVYYLQCWIISLLKFENILVYKRYFFNFEPESANCEPSVFIVFAYHFLFILNQLLLSLWSLLVNCEGQWSLWSLSGSLNYFVVTLFYSFVLFNIIYSLIHEKSSMQVLFTAVDLLKLNLGNPLTNTHFQFKLKILIFKISSHNLN